MIRSIFVEPKKRGRPATGAAPIVGVRFNPEILKRLDAFAADANTSRSEAVRRLVEKGLTGQ